MWTLEAIAECLTRRARKQRDPAFGPSRERAFDTKNANAWYGASRGDGRRQQLAAETRCDAVLDSGRTRGDDREETTACLHFARGRCSAGGECAFLHRLPTALDDARASLTHDVFGRERHATDREDNAGVGNFTRDVKTLFAHYGGVFPDADADFVRDAIHSDFAEWGPVSSVRVLPTKCVAFVTYAHRSAAEFAKEAMAGQTPRKASRNAGVLSVRWANDDPNPAARAEKKRAREETAADAFARHETRVAPERRRALAQARALETRGAYPDTDAQYPRSADETRRRSETTVQPVLEKKTPNAPPPPPAPPTTTTTLPAIDADELERIRAAVGVVVAAPAETAVDADADDEDAFDPDDYPEFDVEEVSG